MLIIKVMCSRPRQRREAKQWREHQRRMEESPSTQEAMLARDCQRQRRATESPSAREVRLRRQQHRQYTSPTMLCILLVNKIGSETSVDQYYK